MIKIWIFICAIILFSVGMQAQYDDKLALITEHTFRIEVGSIAANNFRVQYRNTQGEAVTNARTVNLVYEKKVNHYLSLGISYQHLDYDLNRYQLLRHSNRLNIFYTPFSNTRLLQVKLGTGIAYNIAVERIADELFENIERYSRYDGGVNCSVHLDYFITRNVSLGLSYHREFNFVNTDFQGLRAQVGYAF